MSSRSTQMDELLTCAICLENYRNPKVLPCQHTFCAEPCLMGLINDETHRIRCPECRAEHHVSNEGVHTFPNNVTVNRFLELHLNLISKASATSLCPECNKQSCDELKQCLHCEKILCENCLMVHTVNLRFHITTMIEGVRRDLPNLGEAVNKIQNNAEKMKTSGEQAIEEVDKMVINYVQAITDHGTDLKKKIETIVSTEYNDLRSLGEKMAQDLSAISNICKMVEEHIAEKDSKKLLEYNNVFIKILSFLKNLNIEATNNERHIKFDHKNDIEDLRTLLRSVDDIKVVTVPVTSTQIQECTSFNDTVQTEDIVITEDASEDHLMSLKDYDISSRLQRLKTNNDFQDDEKQTYSYTCTFSHNMYTYLQKGHMIKEITLFTSEPKPKCYDWPMGVAATDDSIIVCNNFKSTVQIFDASGTFRYEFGSHGTGRGQFMCLAGVAVNKSGQLIVADHGNHRIQVFDLFGNFLNEFGFKGTKNGCFQCPYGVATDDNNFIYVCDKMNNRVQIFEPDGSFIFKFGKFGSRPGYFRHPHYIVIKNDKIFVSDTNNHRVQIFDKKSLDFLSSFGTEGFGKGEFMFPKGIAVDDDGLIIVANNGNNTVQVFHPDGTFLKMFSTCGSDNCPDGITVTSNNNILVCDPLNHRIQVF